MVLLVVLLQLIRAHIRGTDSLLRSRTCTCVGIVLLVLVLLLIILQAVGWILFTAIYLHYSSLYRSYCPTWPWAYGPSQRSWLGQVARPIARNTAASWDVMVHNPKIKDQTYLSKINLRIMDLDQYLEKMITNTIVIWILFNWLTPLVRSLISLRSLYFNLKTTTNTTLHFVSLRSLIYRSIAHFARSNVRWFWNRNDMTSLLLLVLSLTLFALFNSNNTTAHIVRSINTNIALFVRSTSFYIRFISFAFAHYIRWFHAHSLTAFALLDVDLALVTGLIWKRRYHL